MTELALVLPILVVLVLGIAQFGVVFNNYVTMTDAVRAGARKGAVSRNLSDPSAACVTQVRDASGGLKQSDLIGVARCLRRVALEQSHRVEALGVRELEVVRVRASRG